MFEEEFESLNETMEALPEWQVILIAVVCAVVIAAAIDWVWHRRKKR